MNLYEMLIDEDNLFQGVNAISLVENPAIQSDWVALSKDSKKIQLAEVNAEKRILVGAALIPDKPIYRNQNGEEFYIYFSADTVRKAAELFFKNHNQDKATLEHETALEGLHIFESWIVEDTTHDKSRAYGLDVPAGSWVVTMKVNDDDIWNNYVKNNKVFGFSIEGQFANQLVKKMDTEMSETVDLDELDLQVALEDAKELLASAYDVELESYNDYPQAAVNNAKRALKYKKENGSSCGTSVGWTRASQIASKKKLSRSTIARMASFKRHQQNKDVPYTEGCGGIMWDAWGGSAGINWAIRKLKQIDNK